MNKEIKEILDDLRKYANEGGEHKLMEYEIKHIQCYITNLEHKSYRDDVIITKAIAYIKSHSNNLMFELRIEEMEDLLNILTENTPTENLYRYTPEKGFELVGGDDND